MTQQKRNKRGAPTQERVIGFLKALEARDFSITGETMAAELNMPLFRLQGLTTKMRRLVNLDGYEVLTKNEDTLILNKALLKSQFEI